MTIPEGFITKEEWAEKGRDPEQWRDPEEFEKRGKEILPIVNANLKKSREEIAALKGDIQSIISFNKDQEEKLRKEGYQKALADVEAERKKAFDDDDYDGMKKADKKRDKIVTEHVNAKPETPKEDPEYNTFVEDNKWYGDDPELKWWADTAGFAVAEAAIQKGKTRKEAFELVAKEVKARFPDKFNNANRDTLPAVEGDAGAKGKKTNGKGWNDLPTEAKASFKRIKEQMALKGREYEKEDYVKNYEF